MLTQYLWFESWQPRLDFMLSDSPPAQTADSPFLNLELLGSYLTDVGISKMRLIRMQLLASLFHLPTQKNDGDQPTEDDRQS